MSEPTLAPPGAGLPAPEAFVIRRLVFPVLQMRLSKSRSLELFKKSGETILPLVSDLDLTTFTTPVLIKRLPGLEDSSRNWSVEQTLEHIQIVTAAALYIIKKLESNRPLDLPVRTQDVKPSGGIGLDRLRSFGQYLEETPKKIAQFEFTSQATHHHPWFGELTSLDWLRLIAFHQDLHRKQIERILAPASC
ncbi:DinB family protein [Roseibacillus persicicus]|nr:DinB family protein [Roseibacillus persicicus]MDQ8191053.1 DinB family protein [Roseibacillus persicicus]